MPGGPAPGNTVQPGQPVPPAQAGAPLASETPPEPNDRRQKLLKGLLALGALLFVTVLIVLMVKVFVKPKPAPVTQVPPPKLCYVRLAHLVCSDTDGKKAVRYDLPALPDHAIVNLESSPDQSQFLSFYQYPPDHGTWLLNNKLQIIKKLSIPAELQPNTPSWTRDGKSILLELSSSSKKPQVYRFTLATGELKQLTDSGTNSQPSETQSGQILYAHQNDQGGWESYVMEADGSRQRTLGDIARSFKPSFGFSYDTTSDMVFAYGQVGDKSQIAYGNIKDLLAGQAAQTIQVGVNAGDQIVKIGDNTLAISHNAGGQVIKISSGQKIADLSHFNSPVGLLKVVSLDGFTKSAQQEESPYERIDKLAGAPTDFQDFIKREFDKADAACKADKILSAAGYEQTMRIIQVLRESFAKVGEFCGDGGSIYYAKVDTVWTKTSLPGQAIASCADVNRYKFPKDMIARCINDKGVEQANNNP